MVAYAFGSGDRGMTLVGPDERGRTRELRLSLYEGETVWDITTGQTTPPAAGADFLGRVLSDDDLRSCFHCHTTVARSARDRTGPESSDPGIGCERCHGPGGNHLTAVALGFPDPAIARPGPDSGAQVVALCAGCHSPLGTKVAKTDRLAPRFPAAGLTWSRCYTESKAALDCLTCHNPHRDAETSTTDYEQKCLECHSAAPRSRGKTGLPHRRRRARPRVRSIPLAVASTATCRRPRTSSPTRDSPITTYAFIPRSPAGERITGEIALQRIARHLASHLPI